MVKGYSFKENEYFPQNEEIPGSIAQNWTQQALECYTLKCDCSKCSISKGNYSFVCQMPKVIDLLIANKVPKLKIVE